MKQIFSGIAALSLFAAASLQATPVTVNEVGVGANHVVVINSSTLGSNLSVYAGIIKLEVNGTPTDSFCIDPWHWSVSGPQSYNLEPLATAPKPPGPMGDITAQEIERLWQAYYSATMSNDMAAGLQIAIWELVDTAVTGGTFSLGAGQSDYGAGDMIAWVQGAGATAGAADLVAVSSQNPTGAVGAGQDYVIHNIPDGGATVALLGLALVGLFAMRKRFLLC
jgi:VPDSG-CTERM motif